MRACTLSFAWHKHTCFLQKEPVCLCSPHGFTPPLGERLLFLVALGPDKSMQIVRLLCISPPDSAMSKAYLCAQGCCCTEHTFIEKSAALIHFLWDKIKQLLKKLQHSLFICIFWTAGMFSGNSHLHQEVGLICESPPNNAWHTYDIEIQNWLN